MKYTVWLEGFHVQEGITTASLEGVVEANSFREATAKASLKRHGQQQFDYYYNDKGEYPTFYGCGYFDNEKDARKSFG